jgi:hypothetical protein
VVPSALNPTRRADCESLALELREDLKLTAAECLDPCVLADFLEIPALSFDAFAAVAPDAVAQLRAEEERYSFSAATVSFGARRLIVYHPDHGRRRHVNSIAHELAHILLEHPPTPLPLFDDDGRRLSVSPQGECEADYLAGALLAPRCVVAAVMGRRGEDLTRAARHFGISEKLMAERLRASEAADPLCAREVAVMLRMTEEEMATVRRVAIKQGQLGDWESIPAP